MLDVNKIRTDFPLLVNQPDLVYLDSTATALKPKSVIQKENEYYQEYCANIFRGIYKISEKATSEYETVREKTAKFIGCRDPREIIFNRNATEAINIVASSWGRENMGKGNEIVTTIMEHHANFVTWQELVKVISGKLHVVGLKDNGYLNQEELLSKVNKKTKLVTFTHISNVLGTINPVKKMIAEIKRINPQCLVLVDGAQAVPHMKVNITDLGCDFYVFSSHKMLGPTGIGVLWGRYELLHNMKPYQYGGEMISAVYVDHSEYKDTPHRFEAGTPHIAGVIGFGAAIDYLEKLGMEEVRRHEVEILRYSLKLLKSLKGLKIYGPQKPEDRGGVIAFTMKEAHAHDIAQILDSNNICVRSGHHCAMPLHIQLGLVSTARASFYVYTTKEDIDKLVEGLLKVKETFK
jgi:cysteine desulfurase / selenocysteine lyase